MSKQTIQKPDVVVVGAGLGGLATATRLAAAGRRVIVCERAEHAGGRGRTSTREGFSINLGAHALYRSGPAMAMLRELGVSPRGRMPSGRGVVIRDGREHVLPATPVSMLSTSLLDLRSKFALVGFLAQVRRIDASSLQGLSCDAWLERQIAGTKQPVEREASPHAGRRPSTGGLHGRETNLRKLVAALIRLTTYCGDLEQLSAQAAVEQLRSAFGGVLYLDGGWAQLVDALVERAQARGVEFRFGARVESIARADHARWAVQVDGGAIPCTDVVIASSPRVADKLLTPTLGQTNFAAASHPCTAAVLDLGLRGEWPGPRFAVDLDKPIYLSVHSDAAAVAPAGHTLLSLIWYRRRGDELTAEQLRERLDQHVRRWMPSFEQAVVVEQFLPNITVAHDLPQASRGGLAGRSPTRLGDGLHLVGDWVGDRGLLLDASMASATRACEAIMAGVDRAESAHTYAGAARRAAVA